MFNRKCFPKLTTMFAILSLFALSTAQEKDKKSEDKITTLKSRVAELEKTVAELKKQVTMIQSDSVSGAVGMPGHRRIVSWKKNWPDSWKLRLLKPRDRAKLHLVHKLLLRNDSDYFRI